MSGSAQYTYYIEVYVLYVHCVRLVIFVTETSETFDLSF